MIIILTLAQCQWQRYRPQILILENYVQTHFCIKHRRFILGVKNTLVKQEKKNEEVFFH